MTFTDIIFIRKMHFLVLNNHNTNNSEYNLFTEYAEVEVFSFSWESIKYYRLSKAFLLSLPIKSLD